MKALVTALLLSALVSAYIVGAPEPHCSTCHTPANPVKFEVKGLPKYYVPGKEYNVTIAITEKCEGKCCEGFYFSIPAGDVKVSDPKAMKVERPPFGTPYLTHTEEGRFRTSWSFKWIAPKERIPLTFTVSVLKANCDNEPTGDNFSIKEIKVYPEGYVPPKSSNRLPYLIIGVASIAIATLLLILAIA
ncbi:hypothetical protein EYM_05990 [Ignicoccus islandicus DSM 13165]|uniref:Reelin domain-containing protein n=1 Tax=Ignicoccus islandicus DSM 13165 TaxID=940295 RepID=A0A0U3FQM2_9CREN|nr:choice-of-anchor V domain-containing protein [Ignicoccus islandicus]ALU12639.1 hypothetical protein EYM_05990 [Ignicoccus islandicus DSM 13165]